MIMIVLWFTYVMPKDPNNFYMLIFLRSNLDWNLSADFHHLQFGAHRRALGRHITEIHGEAMLDNHEQ